MKNHRPLLFLLLAALLSAAWPAPARAIPVFARKYGFSCTMCHSAFPRLNDFGVRYRDNGYRLPGRESEEKTVLESLAPIAARLSGGYTDDTYKDYAGDEAPEDTHRFMMNGVDILSGGVLGPHMGYLVVLPPQVGGAPGLDGQDGTLEMASVAFSDLGSPWLNVRVGRFEPAYVACSVKRSLTASPYEAYEYGAPGGLLFSETQNGIEITGHGRAFHYAAGCVNGSPTNRSIDGPADFYVRTSAVVGPGEGQTAGQRIGLTGYFGRARPDPTELPADSPSGFYRVGADASLNYRQVNLSLQYLYGKDDKTLWDPGREDDVSYSGGFGEFSVMPMTTVVAFCRLDWIDAPGEIALDLLRGTGGVRYYLVSNVAAHLEFSRLQESATEGADPTNDFVTARLDFAF